MNWCCVFLVLITSFSGNECTFIIQKIKDDKPSSHNNKNHQSYYASSRYDLKKQSTKKHQHNQSSKYRSRGTSKQYKLYKTDHHNTFHRNQYPNDSKKNRSTVPTRNFSFSYIKGLENTNSKTSKIENHRKSHRSSKPAPSFSFINYSNKKKQSQSQSQVKPETESFVYTPLTLNQWTEFYFIEPNQLPYSRWSFTIEKSKTCLLQVVDSFCTGDRFEAIRLLPTGIQIPLLTTPPVPYNHLLAATIRSGQTTNVTCEPFTTDPQTAWDSTAWSKGQVKLFSGDYKLILKSILAPYGSGGAFLRLLCQ